MLYYINKKKDMKFSIITVCWNNLNGLKKTAQSILNQDYIKFEWLIIDGKSTDGTIDYVNSLNDKRLNFFSEKDDGLYDAMNKGIANAKGDYMIFMNSGDLFFAPSTLGTVAKHLINNENTGLLYGDSYDYDHNNNMHYRKARHHSKAFRGMFTQHQSMFFKVLQKQGQPKYDLNYKLSADYKFILEYLNLEKKDLQLLN